MYLQLTISHRCWLKNGWSCTSGRPWCSHLQTSTNLAGYEHHLPASFSSIEPRCFYHNRGNVLVPTVRFRQNQRTLSSSHNPHCRDARFRQLSATICWQCCVKETFGRNLLGRPNFLHKLHLVNCTVSHFYDAPQFTKPFDFHSKPFWLGILNNQFKNKYLNSGFKLVF